MHAYANMALRAARRAGQIMVRAMDRLDELTVEEKATNDLVSNIDRQAEQAIVEILHEAYPDHGIRGEEHGQSYPEGQYNWVIDPLDGTLNYLQGIPHFCVSIACMKGRHIEHAVILDPLRNEEFVGSRGAGAQLNGRRMRVTQTKNYESAVLSTGIPPGAIKTHLEPYMAGLTEITGQARGVRRLGSAALDLAYVAAGRTDGFWEYKLKPWDIAAGVLLVQEAGGFVGDPNGGDSYMTSGDIVAANPKLFKVMVQTLKKHPVG